MIYQNKCINLGSYFMFLLPKIRERKMKPFLQREIEFYETTPKDIIEDYQLQQFNVIWKDIQKNVEYYRNLVDNKELPKRFKTFNEFKSIPIVTRDFVNRDRKSTRLNSSHVAISYAVFC